MSNDTDVTIELDQLIKEKKDREPPRRFDVIMHNDDVTTFRFVIEILVVYFKRTPQDAVSLTNQVHNTGSAVVGTYSREVAETKVYEAESIARAAGFPLRLTFKPAPE